MACIQQIVVMMYRCRYSSQSDATNRLSSLSWTLFHSSVIRLHINCIWVVQQCFLFRPSQESGSARIAGMVPYEYVYNATIAINAFNAGLHLTACWILTIAMWLSLFHKTTVLDFFGSENVTSIIRVIRHRNNTSFTIFYRWDFPNIELQQRMDGIVLGLFCNDCVK